MTAIIIQARLDSTRLPQKALLDLAGKPVLLRVMENMNTVPADARILACDADSHGAFAPLAKAAGFECVSGPKEDVLERFCIAIRKSGATTILRATGDNPFLFADAAIASLERFASLGKESGGVDYFTFTGLPHGSGIEVFSARSLLEAAALTDLPYDREHVGPALYNHPDRFTAIREPAPAQWYFPDVRTTIDTPSDYERACEIADRLASRSIPFPPSSSAVLDAWKFVAFPFVLIPAHREGQGTGHLRRMADLAAALSGERRCLVYLPEKGERYAPMFRDTGATASPTLPLSAALVVVDGFRTSREDMARYRSVGPVLALDEGGAGRGDAEYLLDIIPSRILSRIAPNARDAAYLALPVNRKKNGSREIRTVLVLAGGENAARLALPAAKAIAADGFDVTVIEPGATGLTGISANLTVSGPVRELRESLWRYDLVVTHFGLTAFEALAAGCRVVLFSPTAYHYRLAVDAGFSAIPPGCRHLSALPSIIEKGIRIPSVVTPETEQGILANEVLFLAEGEKSPCPLCGGKHVSGKTAPAKVTARYPDRTVARCPVCGMRFLLFRAAGAKQYSRSYFFDEYKAQYGKTYLEDFESIKAQGRRRIAVIDSLFRSVFGHTAIPEKNVLDVGCAFGPFLSAARDAGWAPFGTDISQDAVAYVRDVLSIPAWTAAFPAPDRDDETGRRSYAALTMWFVIEHFRDLEPVLSRSHALLTAGGILAFSTPSCSGVSGRFSPASFYRKSPGDHYTIWDPRAVRKQLARSGFTVKKIVSTGHHPERFPFMSGKKPDSIAMRLLSSASRLFSLGDSFEVYAVKNGTLEDAI